VNESSDAFEQAFKSNENQILGCIMGGVGVLWNSFKVSCYFSCKFSDFYQNE
jgi:hypothetical protein